MLICYFLALDFIKKKQLVRTGTYVAFPKPVNGKVCSRVNTHFRFIISF